MDSRTTRSWFAVLTVVLGLVIGLAPSSGAASDHEACRRFQLIGSLDGAPTGTDPCPGIRPGGWIESSKGLCTINFIFWDGKRTLAGTAGHCVKRVGEVVSSVTLDRPIGRVAYKLHKSFFRDFALIAIYPELADDVTPEACAWGGPTGIATGTQPDYSEIHHMGYGYGLGYVPTSQEGQPLTYARRGIAPRLDDSREMHFLGTVTGGDSGSGAYLSDGSALGVITVIEASVSTDDGVRGIVGGARLDYLMSLAARKLQRPIYLVTADGTMAGPGTSRTSTYEGGRP